MNALKRNVTVNVKIVVFIPLSCGMDQLIGGARQSLRVEAVNKPGAVCCGLCNVLLGIGYKISLKV